MEIRRLDATGRPTRIDRLGYDGKAPWKQSEVSHAASEFKSRLADVVTELGVDPLAGLYEAAASPKGFLGDSVLRSSQPLHARIAGDSAAELLDDSRVYGSLCSVVRWRSATDADGAVRRYTLWLDRAHGLVVRRSLEEASVPGGGWVMLATGRVPEIGVVDFATDSGTRVDYYHPRTILTETFDPVGHGEADVGRYDVEEVRVNPRLSADLFEPRIDEGTGLLDRSTGIYSIVGSGPISALSQRVAGTIEEARCRAREVVPCGADGPRSPLPIGGGLIAASAVGLVGLIIAMAARAGATRRSGFDEPPSRSGLATWLLWFSGTLTAATAVVAVVTSPATWVPATPEDLVAPRSQAAAERLSPRTAAEQGTSGRRRDVGGPLALACAAAYAGRPDLIEAAFRHIPSDGHRPTLGGLQAAAAGLGFATRVSCWRPGARLEFQGPAILRLDPLAGAGAGHLLVALEATGDRVLILDFPHAPEWLPTKELWRDWDGVALHVATSGAGLPRRRSAAGRTLVSALIAALGLSVLFVALGCAGRPPARATARSLAVSAILPAIIIAPTLGRGRVDRLSPISRPELQAVPTFLPLEVDVRMAETIGPEGIVATYRILNRGDRPAFIAAVEPSGGCTAVAPRSNCVPAGGSVGLSIRIPPPRGRGKTFSARVVFHEPPDVRLELMGNLTVSPGRAARATAGDP
jgi:hypothetical protein